MRLAPLHCPTSFPTGRDHTRPRRTSQVHTASLRPTQETPRHVTGPHRTRLDMTAQAGNGTDRTQRHFTSRCIMSQDAPLRDAQETRHDWPVPDHAILTGDSTRRHSPLRDNSVRYSTVLPGDITLPDSTRRGLTSHPGDAACSGVRCPSGHGRLRLRQETRLHHTPQHQAPLNSTYRRRHLTRLDATRRDNTLLNCDGTSHTGNITDR